MATEIKYFACCAAPDRKHQIEILVTRDGVKKTQVETGVVYPNFKTAWKALGEKKSKMIFLEALAVWLLAGLVVSLTVMPRGEDEHEDA